MGEGVKKKTNKSPYYYDSEGYLFIEVNGERLSVYNHAVKQMRRRSITNEQLYNTIKETEPFYYKHESTWKKGYYDPKTKIFVARLENKILTVINGVESNYINNLKTN